MVPSIREGSRIKVELVLDVQQLRSYGFSVSRQPDRAIARKWCLEAFHEAVGLYHFFGKVLRVHAFEPLAHPTPLNLGLAWYYADLDVGIPVYLGGLLGADDPLRKIEGQWIDGVATLWGNVSSPESPEGRQVEAVVVGIRELDPIRRGSHTLVFRLLRIELRNDAR